MEAMYSVVELEEGCAYQVILAEETPPIYISPAGIYLPDGAVVVRYRNGGEGGVEVSVVGDTD